jgi:hypothetical protein
VCNATGLHHIHTSWAYLCVIPTCARYSEDTRNYRLVSPNCLNWIIRAGWCSVNGISLVRKRQEHLRLIHTCHAAPMPFPCHAMPWPCHSTTVPCPSWKSVW